MYCNRCGNEIKENQQFCNICGNRINNKKVKNNRNVIVIVITIVIAIVIILGMVMYLVKISNKRNYYINEESIPTKEAEDDKNVKTSKYKTEIITDNVYSGISVKNIDDANKLIVQDSVNQKKSDYSQEIIEIENDIIEKYSIIAVNLKEMDVDFARELENVIKNIYTEYPNAREHLTNLTLTNLDMSEANVIALFRPVFMFGTSNTRNTRPWVIKTQVELNAKYFLNQERLDSTVTTSSKVGHFPQNATRYSPVAHELGHYLSFIALMNSYNTESIVIINDNQIQNYYDIIKDFSDGKFSKKMLDEAYNNYIQENSYVDFDEWRGQISEYALAKDGTGAYIYDETIAEAFHDVYLNNNNANVASKYITKVLKKYIAR